MAFDSPRATRNAAHAAGLWGAVLILGAALAVPVLFPTLQPFAWMMEANPAQAAALDGPVAVLTMSWGLATGALALWAAYVLGARPERGGLAAGGLMLAAVLSLPATGGFGLGALLAYLGARAWMREEQGVARWGRRAVSGP